VTDQVANTESTAAGTAAADTVVAVVPVAVAVAVSVSLSHAARAVGVAAAAVPTAAAEQTRHAKRGHRLSPAAIVPSSTGNLLFVAKLFLVGQGPGRVDLAERRKIHRSLLVSVKG
jgi:hypothetical protein